jgi:hypothetical protein
MIDSEDLASEAMALHEQSKDLQQSSDLGRISRLRESLRHVADQLTRIGQDGTAIMLRHDDGYLAAREASLRAW